MDLGLGHTHLNLPQQHPAFDALPVENDPFQRAVLLNPLVYASEGFRLALTPEMPHMSPWLVYGGLLGFSLLFTWLGLRKFQSRAVD